MQKKFSSTGAAVEIRQPKSDGGSVVTKFKNGYESRNVTFRDIFKNLRQMEPIISIGTTNNRKITPIIIVTMTNNRFFLSFVFSFR